MTGPYTKLEGVAYKSGNLIHDNGYGVSSGSVVQAQYATNKKVGYRSPNFQYRLTNRQDASYPYTLESYILRQKRLFSQSAWIDKGVVKTSLATTWHKGNLNPVTSMPIRPTEDDRALRNLKYQLEAGSNRFKLLVPLAEINETRRLVRSTAETTGSLLKTLLELKHGHVKGLFQKASKAWLQFSFAISPTISDCNAVASSISDYLTRGDFVNSIHGNGGASWFSRGGSTLHVSACTGARWVMPPVEYCHTYKVRYSAGVNFNLRSGNNYGLADQFGLEFGQLLPAAWELVPFSWVMDYFTTTGAFLDDAFTSSAGTTFYCTKTQKYRVYASNLIGLEPISTSFVVDRKSQTQEATSFIMKRSVLGQLPHRAMRLKTADEIGKYAVNKILNLASILLGKR